MSQEQIIDALEFIDDDMIESVNVLRKYPERHKHLWLNYVAVAACIMLAIFGGFKYLGNNVSTENHSSVNNGSTNQKLHGFTVNPIITNNRRMGK